MSRRWRASLAVAAGLALLCGGCAASGETSGEGHTPAAGVSASACPATVQLSASQPVRVGAGVGPLVVSGTTVYAARPGAGTVTRLAGGGRTVVRIGGRPVSLAVGFEKLWIALRDAGKVVGLALGPLTQVAHGSLPVPVTVTTGPDGVWALSLDEEAAWQLSTATGAVGTPIDSPVAAPDNMVVVGHELWILGAAQAGFSPVNTQLFRFTRIGFNLSDRSVAGLSTYGGVLWLAEPAKRDLVRVVSANLATTELRAPAGMAPVATAAGPCGVWIADGAGKLALVDARTGELRAPVLHIGRSVAALAASGTSVWASDPIDGTIVQVSAH